MTVTEDAPAATEDDAPVYPQRTREPVARLRDGTSVLRMTEVMAAELGERLADENDQTMIMNMGPQHPSTHGVLRLMLELDGETVVRSKPIIGLSLIHI